jgi:urease accessory protein
VYVLTKKNQITELENIINENLKKINLISGGTSILPNEAGIIVKILGNNTEKVFEGVYNVLKSSRKKILGAEFSKIRKN